MGQYLAKGSFNIILKQKPYVAISTLLTLERLYKKNQTYAFAEPYAKGLMVVNEGQWYSFVLSELLIIYNKFYQSKDGERLNDVIDEYYLYLQSTTTNYTKEQLEMIKCEMK